ncbi:MAG TPA: hypothetical protein DIT33_15235 [Pseudomonas sp.]|uniref:fatty acid desaturase family protein n=1 Tax=Pseudomonas sp. TaxID=306 RepID=UPI000EE876BB|nr:acyl-CoA desaturase [Pseudomonas sp.]HCN64730.1 hypothetical protein [Pseudomonas sp.]
MNSHNHDFALLRQSLITQGYTAKTPWAIFAEWLLFVLLAVSAITVIAIAKSLWLLALAFYLIVMASMGITTNAHTASHHAISRRRWVNTFFLYFGYPFFSQLSANFWQQKHLVIHHPHPNVIGVDNDANLAPFFALHQTELQRAHGLHRWWYEHQGYFLPLVLAGNSFAVIFQGWSYLIGQLTDRQRRKAAHWWDLATLLLHWLVWVVLPCFFFSIEGVLMFTLLRFTAMSYAMFALFAPAHYPAAACIYESEASANFVMRQTITTINFRTGHIGRLLCGGVEYQIEHHLFPTISPRHYPAISPILKRFCEQQGYPYRTEGWLEAIRHSLDTFWHPKPVHKRMPPMPSG